jgi:polyphosphate kinase
LWLAVNRDEQRRGWRRARTTRSRPGSSALSTTRSLDNNDGYTEAAATMFAATHTPNTPWAVVNPNDKRTAMLNAIGTC